MFIKSWKHNNIDQGYWVYSSQVSKTPESGEYISKGSFIIRGKKNYITPELVLGFGIIFKTKGEMIIKNLIDKGKDLEWAIPLLAPYSVIKKLKFHVKLVPGNQKITKSVNNIINKFKSLKDANLVEKSLINNIDKDLAYKTLIGNIYIKY